MPYYPPPAPDMTAASIAFRGQTPVPLATGYTQTYATTIKTLSAYTSNSQSVAMTGGLLDLLQAARLTDLNSVRVAYENLRVFAENLAQQHNQLIADLKALGLIGS